MSRWASAVRAIARERTRTAEIRERNGQFGQGAAEPGGEPGDRMQTARLAARRGHSVQDDEGAALSGSGQGRPRRSPRWGGSDRRAPRQVPYASGQSARRPSQGSPKGWPLVTESTHPRRSGAWFGVESVAPGMRVGEWCHRRAQTSNRPAAQGRCARPRNLLANSPPMFTPSGGGSGDARPLPTGTGRVGDRTGGTRGRRQLTERHPGP